MDGVLSQEEINALLNNPGASSDTAEGQLSDSEKDTIGEIANISMGTAATTLFSLVNRKVEISTPVVTMANWDDVVKAYERPCVFIRIGFTVGLDGSNILILKEHDVKVITDLMMGGDGTNTGSSTTACTTTTGKPASTTASANDKSAADDGTANDGAANDGTTCRYVGNVCKPAGKCTAGSVPKFYWRYEWGISKGKY